MTDKTIQKIAKTTKNIRIELGLTQAILAKKAGISVNYYARFERAEVMPSVAVLKKITKALGVKSSDILPF